MSRKRESKRTAVLGLDPLAYRREPPPGVLEVEELIKNASFGQRVSVAGRIMLSDPTGKISKLGVFTSLGKEEFIICERLQGNGFSIPVYIRKSSENITIINTSIQSGDIVMFEGAKHPNSSDSAENIFLGENITLLSKSLSDVYDNNIDFRKRSNLYTHRHLQMIQDQGKVLHFRRCSKVFSVIRKFLYERGYEEVNITLLQESFEAGFADPFATYVVEHRRDMYLRLTSEFFLRKLMIAGFSGVFEIGKSFRNQGAVENMIPQFTILELYRAYASAEEIEDLLQLMICEILVELHGTLVITTARGEIDCSGPWSVYDFREEVLKLTGREYNEGCSVEELASLLDKVGILRPRILNKKTISTALYSHVVSEIKGPAFLRNLPAAQSPLFKINDDGSTVDETLLVINGMLVADIVNPERDPFVMKRRLQEQLAYREEPRGKEINEKIIEAMKLGLPPCRGIGMGLERLLMLLLNARSIREVDLFPVF